MDADVAVETAPEVVETPSAPEVTAESETPSVDAQAENVEGDAPSGEVDPLLTYLQSKGFKSLEDPAARAALHENLRSAQNYASTSATRIKELEAELAKRANPAPSPEPEPEPEIHPDIKGIDEYISTLKGKLDALPQRERDLVSQSWALDREIAKAEARLEDADDLDKPKRELELARLQAQHANLRQQLEGLPELRERYETETRRAERDRKLAEQSIQFEERARQEAGVEREKWETGLVSEVNTLIPRFANEFKLPADPELRKTMSEDVYDALTVELWRRAQANIKDVNIQELLRNCVDKWAKKHGLVQAAKLAQVSKAKAPVAGKPSGTPQKTATPPNSTERSLSIHERMAQEEAARIAKLAAMGL